MGQPLRLKETSDHKKDHGVVKHPVKAAKLLHSVPNVILRGPIYIIFLILMALIVYASWAKKDDIVIAPLTLQKKTITVEAIGPGQVIDVRVKPNSWVESNTLFALVQEKVRAISKTEQETIDSSIHELEKEKDKVVNEIDYRIAQMKLQLVDSQKANETQKVSIQGKIDQLEEKIKTTLKEKELREKEFQTALSRYLRAKKRFENRDIVITQFEAIEAEMDRRRKAVSDAEAALAQLRVSLRTSGTELETASDLHVQERILKNIEQMESRREREIEEIEEAIASLRRKKEQSQRLIDGVRFQESVTQYRSVYDGLVTSVHVKQGQMIVPGDPLVTMVKDTAVLEGRARVMNQDIGKIKAGQLVQIKYFAYPYQEYGTARGVIKEVGKKPEEVGADRSMYVVKVALEKEVVSPIGSRREHPLEIGIEGTVEIKTGEKRWIELVFTPVSRFFDREDSV